MSVPPAPPPGAIQGHAPETGASARLFTRILDLVASNMLPAEPDAESAEARMLAGISHAKARLHSATGEMDDAAISEIEGAVRDVLARHAAMAKEAAQRTALETQHIVGVLNHALLALAGGSQRSVSRMQRIQESLQRASQIRDPDALRTSLSEATRLIRDEAIKEEEHSAKDLAAFEAEVVSVRRKLASNPLRRLSGRAEAIRELSAAGAAVQTGEKLYIAAFFINTIQAIVNRYGADPVEELFLQIVRERVQPLSEVSNSWRWSSACVVSLFESGRDLLTVQAEMARLSNSPLVYRMTLGNRTAVLKVAISHLVIEFSAESLSEGIAELDRFSGIEVSSAP